MPNLGTVLKTEISRLARKEVRGEVEALKKASSTYRREIAELKRQVANLERAVKQTAKALPAQPVKQADHGRIRFSANGLKSHRARLGLSAADFGALVGVSALSIYNWERGKAAPRQAQLQKLANVRGLGKKEARARLERS
ncbi:helix-turn-helix domain-containing protein [Lysobacter panacisoli]|uniref:HTH cro/C1-type domain-containing protein n=1 Tax=Lysobacter panacisoli TaxID=1255263 RepID=A0ABP9LD38_9GAMM|nr:helix-turn-helix transcriptional regulator [Lysobacter panacisoli]